MQGTTRKSVLASLLAGLLICLALLSGCGGDEETPEEDSKDPSIAQNTSVEELTEEDTQTKSSDGKARAGEARLEMEGDEGTEFTGSCTVGDETSALDGQAPESFTYQLDGERLDCEINASGNLQIDFTVGQNTRSVQQISGGTLNLTYENGRISSSSTSSGSAVSSSQSSSSSIKISP